MAIIGYGSQGRAQALNLRDSGVEVVVGLRPGSGSRREAEEAGIAVEEPAAAVSRADVVVSLVPDEAQAEVFSEQIGPHLRSGAYLGFAHGFAVRFGGVRAGSEVNVFLAAPRGPGPMIRRRYEEGTGFACSLAVAQDPSGDTAEIARAYAEGIGGSPGALFWTSFEEECEADLFGEQAVLCGGLVELIRAGYETLTEAGVSPEMAYFECLHEVKFIADLIHERGIAGMREGISNTARFGGLTRGRRIVGEEARAAMRAVLDEIRSGAFAEEMIDAGRSEMERMKALQRDEARHPMEDVGRRVRNALE